VLSRSSLAGVGIGLAIALSACENPRQEAVVDPQLVSIEADYIIFGNTHYLTRKGIREALVVADTAYFFNDSTVVLLRGNVTLTAYHEDLGTEKAVVTSDRGRLNTSDNSMVAQGNAVLEIAEGERRIESSELSYHPEQDRIWSDSATVMYEAQTIVEGSGFDADLNFTQVLVRNARTRGGSVRF
jgi:LPS export ABC transporter protein LptC